LSAAPDRAWFAAQNFTGISPSQGATANHVLHLGGKLLQAEGFRQEIDIAIAIEPLSECVFSITRYEDHFYIGTYLPHIYELII
jgi:hypothetical protein